MLSERYEERWCLPELLRNKGGASALEGLGRCLARGGGVSPASARLGGFCDGTLAWELRAAISPARLRRDQEH
jgi:hypothetical protein